jgi:segregation and condensation protein B
MQGSHDDTEPVAALPLETRRAIEAIVMVADEPADPRLLAQLVEVSPEVVDVACEALAAEYAAERRGFELVRVAGGWRFQSHAELSPYVERFVLSGQSARLSAAALETLAIVAYKQPISRAQVSAIRGVNVDAVMRTLAQRGYIAELARDPGPGQAVLFGTTSLFLERLGLNSLDELPSLGDFVPGPEVLEALEAGLRVEPDDTAAADQQDVGDSSPERAAGEPQSEDSSELTITIDLSDRSGVTTAPSGDAAGLEALEVLADHVPPGLDPA